MLEINKTNQKEKVLDHKNDHHLIKGRIISQHKDLYEVMEENRIMHAKVSGKFLFDADHSLSYPTVGDYVMMTMHSDFGIIHKVLERKSLLQRKSAGGTSAQQMIASNIDVVCICMSLNENFHLRKLEKYLSLVWASGATPVVVLSKMDLSNQFNKQYQQVLEVSIGVDIIVTSSVEEPFFKHLENYLKEDLTYCFIGGSGVGKSTMINHVLHQEVLTTKAINHIGEGRHTTTSRHLFKTDHGAWVIDTPGMREILLDEALLDEVFTEIEMYSKQCKFNNCKHISEPGCAVKHAISQGLLDEDRLKNYVKMEKELMYQQHRAREKLRIQQKKK